MKENRVKIYGLVLGILLFIGLVAGFSYAYYVGSVSNNAIQGNACFDINYTKGGSISNTSVLLFDEGDIIKNNTITIKNGMAITSVGAGIKTGCNIDAYLTINLTATVLDDAYISGDSVGAFKYVVAEYSSNTYPTVSISTLSGKTFNIVKKGSITSTNKESIYNANLSVGSQNSYLIIFYIDGNLANNNAGNKSFSATIEGVATQGEV